MSNLLEKMRCKPDFCAETGATVFQIEQAEKSLGLNFALDYKEYLHEFGAVSFGGHELTGFSTDKNLNVVEATKKNWEKHNVGKNLYVIEEAHIDGIVIWQSELGCVYQTSPSSLAIKIANSLLEYIELSYEVSVQFPNA